MRDTVRDEIDRAMIEMAMGKNFNPDEPRNPHTGEWIGVGGVGISLKDAEAWAASAPKGGWGGIVGHTTTPENIATIRADGFDLNRSLPDGELGPGIYFSSLDLADLGMFGSGRVDAAVRLTKPASSQVVNEVRQSVREAMGGPDAVRRDPSGFAQRFLAEMRRRGFDGAASPSGDVVAVYDPETIKVIRK